MPSVTLGGSPEACGTRFTQGLSEGSPPLAAWFEDPLAQPGLCPRERPVGGYREGIWYVIMTLSSVSAISSQTGSWRTPRTKRWPSATSAFTFALWLFSEESMLPKYLLVRLVLLLPLKTRG